MWGENDRKVRNKTRASLEKKQRIATAPTDDYTTSQNEGKNVASRKPIQANSARGTEQLLREKTDVIGEARKTKYK